jgi:sulfopyruvate decarboxylase subunit alpha
MMKERAQEVFGGLKEAGVDFVASVPCVYLKDLMDLVERDKQITHVPVTREEEGVGVCAGAYMGGKKPALLMQNSGLGNCTNALASLDLFYGIPLLMVISHRGTEGEEVNAQVPMGNLTAPILQAMGIPTCRPSPGEVGAAIRDCWQRATAERLPVAVLLDVSFWRSP